MKKYNIINDNATTNFELMNKLEKVIRDNLHYDEGHIYTNIRWVDRRNVAHDAVLFHECGTEKFGVAPNFMTSVHDGIVWGTRNAECLRASDLFRKSRSLDANNGIDLQIISTILQSNNI